MSDHTYIHIILNYMIIVSYKMIISDMHFNFLTNGI